MTLPTGYEYRIIETKYGQRLMGINADGKIICYRIFEHETKNELTFIKMEITS